MLENADIPKPQANLGARIDTALGLVGIVNFSVYSTKVIEKAKEGVCILKQISSNSATLSMENICVIIDTLVKSMNSLDFTLDLTNFFCIICGPTSFMQKTPKQKIWKIPRITSIGDIEVSVVALEAIKSEAWQFGYTHLARATNAVELKISTLQYGVPGELLDELV